MLLPNQHSVVDFLEVESNHINKHFVLSDIKIHQSLLYYTFILPHVRFCNSRQWPFGKHRSSELCGSSKCWLIYTFFYITFVNITGNLIRKEHNAEKLLSSWWLIHFEILFCLKLSILALTTQLVIFLKVTDILHSFTRKYLQSIQVWIISLCVSNKWCSMKKAASSPCNSNNCTSMFPWAPQHPSVCRSAFCIIPIPSYKL